MNYDSCETNKIISDIVSDCLHGETKDVKVRIYAYGPAFAKDLISYIENRYPSGHSMRFTMLRDVFKALEVNQE